MSSTASFAPHLLLLDPAGDAHVPAGYTVVDTDVAWLRTTANVTDANAPKVLVRGAERCKWAYNWWQARGGQSFQCASPTTQLLARCPTLTEAQARQILADLPTPPSANLPALPALLSALHPGFAAHWQELPPHPAPTALRQHAARWLIWLSSEAAPFPEHQLPLLKSVLAAWQLSFPASAALFPVTSAEARVVLAAWLGYSEQPAKSPALTHALQWAEQFPLSVSPWLNAASAVFRQQVVTALSAAAVGTKDEAALAWWHQQTAQNQRAEIRFAALSALVQQLQMPAFASVATEHLVASLEHSPVATATLIATLRKLVPPPVPSAPPTEPAAALQWATQQYLPYRRWQASQKDNSEAAAQVQQLAQTFSDWFISAYPDHLVGTKAAHQQQYWAKRALTAPADDEIVLWVIADGLGWGDAHTLQKLVVKEAAGRLSLAAATPCFGLVPTITSHTKRAVRWAVPLHHTDAARANYFAQQPSPPADVRGIDNLAEAVQNAQAGQVLVWLPPEPDSVYHHPGSPKTIRDQAEGSLNGLAISIAEAVAAVPPTNSVRVLITTDHGRLLSESPRTLEPIAGFTGHGRAAFRAKAPAGQPIPRPEGAVDTDTIRWLDPERYRLPDWVAVARTDASFKIVNSNGAMRGGTDIFPHGGAWPEEVVVPWVELHSHLAQLLVGGVLTGESRSNRPGIASLRLVNSSPRPARLRQVEISIPRFETLIVAFDDLLPDSAELQWSVELPRWPDSAQAENTKVTVMLETPDGEQHSFNLTADLRNTDLRRTSVNPLDDLL